MEKQQLVNPYEKEYMKLAMLKHEQTFREQVNELHRLYRIQKLLMKNTEYNEPNTTNNQHQRISSPNGASVHTRIPFDHALCQNTFRPKLSLEQEGEQNTETTEDETDIQLTLGLTTYNRRKQKDNQTPLSSDSGPSYFSSSSTESSSHLNKKRNNSSSPSIQNMMDLKSYTQWDIGKNERRNFNFDVDHQGEELGKDRLKQPPWFLQALSLNMTLRN